MTIIFRRVVFGRSRPVRAWTVTGCVRSRTFRGASAPTGRRSPTVDQEKKHGHRSRSRLPSFAAGGEGSARRRQAVQALVHETLRLYPSAWILPRHATEDDTLAGHTVEAGTDLLVCPYLTHRDPELWPDPEHFDPRRFTTPDGRPTHPGAYFPFGMGPRACLGLQFALRESTVLLEHLLPVHTPVFHSTPTKAEYGITVRPDGPTPAALAPRLT